MRIFNLLEINIVRPWHRILQRTLGLTGLLLVVFLFMELFKPGMVSMWLPLREIVIGWVLAFLIFIAFGKNKKILWK